MSITREQARELVNQRDILTLYPFQKDQGYMYICPVCGSGTNANKTGALSIKPGRKIRCFGGCQNRKDGGLSKGEDTLGALRIIWGCSENEVFERVLGQDWQGETVSSLSAKPKKAERAGDSMTEAKALELWKEKTRAEVEAGIEAIKTNTTAREYLYNRGFTDGTIERFKLGAGKDDKGNDVVIIPYNQTLYYYCMRHIKDIKPKYLKISHSYQGQELKISEPIFNVGALYNSIKKPVFVVESQLCAISIMQAAPLSFAISVGGIGTDRLVEALKEQTAKGIVLILSMDNDKAGEDAQAKLAELLKAQNVPFIEANIAGKYKDPNEALIAEAEAFKERIALAIERAEEQQREEKQNYILANSNQEPLLSFIKGIKDYVGLPFISTGFNSLDAMLDGGLYPGLYIVGAISSLGKTTLCMQIMDFIASQGQDVLIFSLEMDKKELMSKSISRHTFQNVVYSFATNKPYAIKDAKTCRGISDGSKYKYYSDAENKLIMDSTANYGRYARYIFIVEGCGDIGVQEIREKIKEHINVTGNKPVVLVDYLQILAPYKDPEAPNRSFTDKQATDKAALELKRISRDFAIPVVAVSSLNRASYDKTVTMSAFKESGAIEYGADCLIGLEYNGIKNSELDELIEKNSGNSAEGKPTQIKLKILKQRAGARGTSCIFDYYPMFNCFVEQGKTIEQPEEEQKTFIDVTESIDVPF